MPEETASTTDLFEIIKTTRFDAAAETGPGAERTDSEDPCGGGISGQPHSRSPGVDRPLPRRRRPDTLVRVFDLPSGTEHAPGGASARARRDAYDAPFSIREGSGGCT